MGKRIGLLVCAVALVGVWVAAPPVGEAADMGHGGAKWTLSMDKNYTPSPWTSEMGYGNQAMGKLGFGVKNLLLGWTTLFTEPKEAADSGGNVFKGIGVGLLHAVGNELGGVAHVVTFPLTQIDVPLPQGGVQLLNK